MVIVLSLAMTAVHISNPLIWFVYWIFQGTMFWAVFVLGHDCGHGSFSDSVWLNNLVGHFLHSLVLVPYHGWRISHRKHHNNHRHVKNDESWTPWRRSPGKYGSHYNPNNDLFQPHEKWDVITSTICWATALAIIFLSAFVYGPSIVLKLYGVPYANSWTTMPTIFSLSFTGRYFAAWVCWLNSRRALQVVHRIFPKDVHVQPSLVMVYFGGNDSVGAHPSGLGSLVPLPEYIQNMRSLLNHIKSLSETTRIIVLGCPPINEEITRQFHSSWACEVTRTNEALQKYAEACIQVCNDMGLKVIDLFNVIQKKENWETVCFTDGIHFSREGSIIVVEEILKVLRTAEWEPSLHWKSFPIEFSEDSPYDLVAADGKSTFNVSNLCMNWSIPWN